MAHLKIKEACCVVYSILLFVSGILLIGFSALLAYRLFYHFKFVPSGSVGPSIILFILGFIHLLLTWLGVKGPTREHNFHIYMFMAFTFILFLSEFTIGIWSLVLRGHVEQESTQLMAESFDEMIKIDYNKKAWVKLQTTLKCCGLNGSKDYHVKDSYPRACSNMDLSNGTVQVMYEDGCKNLLVKYVKSIMADCAIMAFLSGLFQILGLVTFFFFMKELTEERKRRIQRRMQLERESQQGQQVPHPNTPPVVPTTTQA